MASGAAASGRLAAASIGEASGVPGEASMVGMDGASMVGMDGASMVVTGSASIWFDDPPHEATAPRAKQDIKNEGSDRIVLVVGAATAMSQWSNLCDIAWPRPSLRMNALFYRSRTVLLSSLIVAWSACSSASTHPDAAATSIDATPSSSNFTCSYGGSSVNGGCAVGNYCLATDPHNTGTPDTLACVPLPSGCTGCACAEQDAPKQFPTTTNCSGTISCQQSDGAITVDCN